MRITKDHAVDLIPDIQQRQSSQLIEPTYPPMAMLASNTRAAASKGVVCNRKSQSPKTAGHPQARHLVFT